MAQKNTVKNLTSTKSLSSTFPSMTTLLIILTWSNCCSNMNTMRSNTLILANQIVHETRTLEVVLSTIRQRLHIMEEEVEVSCNNAHNISNNIATHNQVESDEGERENLGVEGKSINCHLSVLITTAINPNQSHDETRSKDLEIHDPAHQVQQEDDN